MNFFLGSVFEFLGWSFFAFIICALNLHLYDGERYPIGDISESDRKTNSRLRFKYAVRSGLMIGALWWLTFRVLISN